MCCIAENKGGTMSLGECEKKNHGVFAGAEENHEKRQPEWAVTTGNSNQVLTEPEWDALANVTNQPGDTTVAAPSLQ